MLYFQGEPFIHPDFPEMISMAHGKKIYTMTSTNGHYLNEETSDKIISSGLDRLIISVDGSTQDVYQQYRVGGDLGRVVSGVKALVSAKRKYQVRHPYIVWQSLVIGPNEHQVVELQRLGRDLGADEVKLKSAQLYNFHQGHKLLPKNQRYSRYQKSEDGTYRIVTNTGNHCWKMWHSAVVTWDGRIVPCCFDKDAKYQFGKAINDDFFNDVWHGHSYDGFRKEILTARSNIDICRNCTEGLRVWR